MNIFNCTARLGNNAEVRQTTGGTSVCTFSGAVDAGYGDRKSTVWIRFALFGKRAEGNLPQYLVKGGQVAISGELSVNTWTNDAGVEKTSLEVNVNTLDLVGGKREQSQQPTQQQQQPQRNTQPQQQEMYPSDQYQGSGGDTPF